MADADANELKPRRRRKAEPAAIPSSPQGNARRPEPELDTPDPVEIAMKAVAAGAVPTSAAQVVLERHAGLIEIQCKREREELANVRVQRITRWLILSAVAALLAAIVALIWNASRSESLVVEPFRVPPALGSAGLGGEVMATRVMDQIALMQSRTLSTRPAESYSTDWGGDINVSIPNTGATVGDLRRLLRSWFGKETRISGEVVRLPQGWNVTARVTGQTAVSMAGPDLEPLVTQVAEQVFRQTQPYRHIIYLRASGRREQALAAARELAMNGPQDERPWGLVAYANSLAGPDIGQRERLPALRRAAEAVPDFPMPVQNYASALESLGRWEEALPFHRRVTELLGDGSAISEQFREQYLKGKLAAPAIMTGAFGDAAAAGEAAGAVGTPAYAVDYLSDAALARYLQHDVRAGDRNLGRRWELGGYNQEAGRIAALDVEDLDSAQKEQLLLRTGAQVARAVAVGDRQALLASLPGQVRTLAALIGSFPPANARDLTRGYWPFIAPELARIGRAAEAEALLAPLELDCYPCLVARGKVAAAKGDREAARRWFAEAARQGPSFPFAHEALGRMLADIGDRAGAEAAFAEALRIQPRWADPAKYQADLLLRAGEVERAAKLYAQASRHAPRWGALHLAWAEALWRLGRRDEARGKLRAAAGMDLSPPHRALVLRMQTKANQRL
ncbi:MAG TPA: hypothetical protein VGB59_01560 [Allosphingosinicella sp.]|jgi:tetratricopeptide (TPR) repeat protein